MKERPALTVPVVFKLAIANVPVLTENELIRLQQNIRGKKALVRSYYDDLMISGARVQPVPFDRYELVFDSYRVQYLDVDAKYAHLKPVIDLLRPQKTGGTGNRGGNLGYGYILDDTDGEAGAPGCCVGLVVNQHKIRKAERPRLDITVIGWRLHDPKGKK